MNDRDKNFKVLWKEHGQPDNFIEPESFLSSLKKNANFRPYTYFQLVLLSCALTQHLASIFIFIALFVRLKNDELNPRILVGSSIWCYIAGYVLWETLTPREAARREQRIKTIKSSILLFLSLVAVAPVLRTLTAATSSDSIWALAASLFILNSLLADYTPLHLEGRPGEKLTSVLSVNAAVSASVVLASRLSDDGGVFCLVLLAIIMFALFPMLRRRLQILPSPVQYCITALLSFVAIVLNASISRVATLLYAGTLLFVTLGAPAVLVWAQRYKK